MSSFTGEYKYKPEDFSGMLCLSDDLQEFYLLLEGFDQSPTDENWWPLRRQWETVFFSIKHREVEGRLSPFDAGEIRNYLEDLINDKLQQRRAVG